MAQARLSVRCSGVSDRRLSACPPDGTIRSRGVRACLHLTRWLVGGRGSVGRFAARPQLQLREQMQALAGGARYRVSKVDVSNQAELHSSSELMRSPGEGRVSRRRGARRYADRQQTWQVPRRPGPESGWRMEPTSRPRRRLLCALSPGVIPLDRSTEATRCECVHGCARARPASARPSALSVNWDRG